MSVKSALYVVATPIGNLNDISLRAIQILGLVDVIAAEHTQNSMHLLSHHRITVKNTKLVALHQHNEKNTADKILAFLAAEKSIALLTDAGTPAVSDPGALLVQRVREHGFTIIPIPGANAAICALSAAGITNPHFLFYGFLPAKAGLRQRALAALAASPYTLIFYEAPHRILECLTDMTAIFGAQRQLTIARELTKLFETIHTCTFDEAVMWINADSHRQKGEFVLLVCGAQAEEKPRISKQARNTLRVLLAELPLKQAVKLTAEISGENRSALYQIALSLKS
ncbi:16S rRNA (cytidine1402-2'-O)-methyltransferase [Nitrosomonas sp. Nm51]|uniref:16S rRNA (cytidine(1402)-2'-O)-methyltransferase n=1 Tax=Nitrosomonas sp. Nm51 TaxID=133720 RepID=UPI0008BEA5AA|nr:16S rRNA (cytidine(1402)-2'-O)-methyltransferase [Nitrosomonas sp. Nm51]SER20691.1 16S rRNA (cytidine1402-2'-O)-methyltransferase [Nitrosomonas sp. Nm51]